MRKLMAVMLLLLSSAIAMPSLAGWNVRQNGDGSTSWVDGDGDAVAVGDSGLVVEIDDLSTESTAYVISHKSGKIKKAYVVIHNAFNSGSNAPVLDIWTQSTVTPNVMTQVSVGATMTPATGTTGSNTSVSPADSNADVSQGQVIAIHTNGASTGAVRGTITIYVE